MSIRVLALVIGLVLNAMGNGLTVSTAMGTSPWTASEVNIAAIVGTPVGLPMFIVGVLVATANQILIHQWDKLRFSVKLALSPVLVTLLMFSSPSLTGLVFQNYQLLSVLSSVSLGCSHFVVPFQSTNELTS